MWEFMLFHSFTHVLNIYIFCIKSLKSSVHFILIAHFFSDTKFSSEIFYLHLDFINCAVDKIHMSKLFQTYLKVFC